MDLRIFTEPQQGATYDDLLAVARAAEDLGYDGFFRSDHYLHFSGDGAPGPTDAWTTLAGLARDTSRIRLGTLVSSATFRLPGPLAVTVAGVDQMSGGRVELGLGAGWFEQEHAAFGIPFPPLGERFDRLEEQLAVITGLWATPPGETFAHEGPHYPVRENPGLVAPVQPGGVPIIVGGGGKRRTPTLAARYAADFNAGFESVQDTGRLFDQVDAVCAEVGRDPSTLVHSAAQVVCLARDDATLRRRAEAIGHEVDELVENSIAGSFEQARERLGRLAEVGTTRVYLQVLDLADLDHVADIHEALAGTS
ncbi:MAG: LLM class F420-dependent oxidoreductase [Ornithinibacter sp.]